MFKLYLKIAFRNMWKHRTQSLIGILGLAFAIACFVPSLFWIRYETSYDDFYLQADRVYRVYTKEKQSGKINKTASKVIERTLREQFPVIEASTSVMAGDEKCKTDEIPYVQLHFLYADSTFLSVFPQTFIYGNTREPLAALNDIVLTESTALRLFGSFENAIGKKIQNTINTRFPPYVVTAIVKDPPAHTTLPFDGLIMHNMLKFFTVDMPEKAQWSNFLTDVYIKFNANANVDTVSARISDLPARLGDNPNIEVRMLPLSDVRHKLNADSAFTLSFINLFVISGILLLLTATFNFLNLYLTLFRSRIREWHLRSVNGATRGSLIRQMLYELACPIVIASSLAYCCILMVRPYISQWVGMEMDMRGLTGMFIGCCVGLMALILCVATLLFWETSRQATRLYSEIRIAGRPVLQRLAVTLQLAVSVIFIVAALVVMTQMRYLSHKDLGFNNTRILQLSGFIDYKGDFMRSILSKLESMPQVTHVTYTNFSPSHEINPFTSTSDVEWPNKQETDESLFSCITADSHFAETFGLRFEAGKWWEEGQMDRIVLNGEAARIMNLKEPVGTVVRMMSNENSQEKKDYIVSGVIDDFHTLSMRNKIQPIIFLQTPYLDNTIYIETIDGQEHEVARAVLDFLPDIDPSLEDATITPVGELYDRLNRSEQIGLRMFSVLAIVCMLISLFGIYAVASSTTRRRRKEIAIRKVFGAEARDIVRIFFREYASQVVIANAFALPIAYIIMRDWLRGYAYRTDIAWWLLLSVFIGVIVIVLFTVLEQILRAAYSNPAKVVKSE